MGNDLLKAVNRVLATFGAMQDYEGQGDRWDDEDNAALDALRRVAKREEKRTNATDGVRKALLEFVDDVESTGGIVKVDGGLYAPLAGQDWIDIGETYIKACEALGRKPKIARPEVASRRS